MMATKDEIREGIRKIIFDEDMLGGDNGIDDEGTARLLLIYLHSQGVVIKVDKELPKNPVTVTDLFGLSKEEALSKNVANDCLVKLAQQDMLKAGCGFFEPLVEE